MFNPLGGFLNEGDIATMFQKIRDVYVWLLNLAAMYQDCIQESTMNNLKFNMHHYLQWEKRETGRRNFLVQMIFGNKLNKNKTTCQLNLFHLDLFGLQNSLSMV